MIFAKIIIKITSAPHRVRQSADAIIINQSLRNIFSLEFRSYFRGDMAYTPQKGTR